MFKILKRKPVIISLVFLLGIIILAGIFIFFQKSKTAKLPETSEKLKREETLAEKQLKELEELRRQADIKPLTEQQKAAQLKELEALRKKANIKPLTREQIQKQLEELEKLRQNIR